ncbi:MAG: Hsp20/alpha crystallin family protein [Candidatus Delongbacteria bacterium]|nr:Hsp20/alpha crystallin family protein [Candidatus Delongbacteria bacterium]MCG2760054.1 Hsp20/alpha crystallin family protein [Candidatus Delongbacteria bacterium]
MDKFRKKLIKYNADGIILDSDQYHYFNNHKTFICDESLGWRPRVDVYEIKEDLYVVVDMPYIVSENVEVVINEDYITIKGIRDQIGHDKKRHYYKMEIDFGPFERVINLPVKIEIATVKQCYKKGFYIIAAKKAIS